MIEIIPAILTDSSLKFKDLVLRLEPYVSRVHVDIADGEFVHNKTITGYDDIMRIETALKFDIHLMVKNPAEHLKEWFYTHADRFIIHAESDCDLGEIIETIKNYNRKVILALNPETNIDKIEKYFNFARPVQSSPDKGLEETRDKVASETLCGIQFMTVHPGFQGGEFVKEVVDKVAAFHAKYPDIMIMADGGITPETAMGLVKAGVSGLVSGSYIVKSQNIEEAIKELQGSCSI